MPTGVVEAPPLTGVNCGSSAKQASSRQDLGLHRGLRSHVPSRNAIHDSDQRTPKADLWITKPGPALSYAVSNDSSS